MCQCWWLTCGGGYLRRYEYCRCTWMWMSHVTYTWWCYYLSQLPTQIWILPLYVKVNESCHVYMMMSLFVTATYADMSCHILWMSMSLFATSTYAEMNTASVREWHKYCCRTWMCVCSRMYVCARKRDSAQVCVKERARARASVRVREEAIYVDKKMCWHSADLRCMAHCLYVCVCVRVCVCMCVCMCVCACVKCVCMCVCVSGTVPACESVREWVIERENKR